MTPPGHEYCPPPVGGRDPVYRTDVSLCYVSVGRNQLPADHPQRAGLSADVVCTLPRGHTFAGHVAHARGGLVLAVLWNDPALILPEGL